MKILDRYVAKNFIVSYAIALFVLIGLCLVIDLFVNLSEFAEHSEIGTREIFKNIVTYYGSYCALWYRDLAGMIIVIAATFSFFKMTRNNELIAVMASGVSLKRVMAPVIILSIILTGLMVFDQELVIPRLTNYLVRNQDDLIGQEQYELRFIADKNGKLICTMNYDEQTETMKNPVIIDRIPMQDSTVWDVLGYIQADSATYNHETQNWDLKNGRYIKINKNTEELQLDEQHKPVAYYESDITPKEIPIRQQEGYKSLLSSAQLTTLARQGGTRQKDLAELYLQKYSRITDPIINIVMLLLSLPILVRRDPKALKTGILKCQLLVIVCFITTYLCKMFGTEVIFNSIRPELWVWAPIFIFLPIAVMELDSMKT